MKKSQVDGGNGGEAIATTKPPRFSPEQIIALRCTPPLIATEPEMAIIAQRSERALREDRRARRIPHFRLGGAVRYRVPEVMKALERLEVRAV